MYHQQRLAATMARFFPGATVPTLTDALSQCHCPADKTWKVHVEYDGTGILLVRAEEYHIRTIRRLRLVYCDDISYAYKSADRHRLIALAASGVMPMRWLSSRTDCSPTPLIPISPSSTGNDG